jgi:hypothetical protein
MPVHCSGMGGAGFAASEHLQLQAVRRSDDKELPLWVYIVYDEAVSCAAAKLLL